MLYSYLQKHLYNLNSKAISIPEGFTSILPFFLSFGYFFTAYSSWPVFYCLVHPKKMAFIHPIQAVIASKDDDIIYTIIKNTIAVFQRDSSNLTYRLIGTWVDTYDRTESVREKVTKEQERQILQNMKEHDDNSGEPALKKRREAKVPTAGPGAPPVYAYLRNLMLSGDSSRLFACADSDKSVLVFDIDLKNTENCLHLVKRQPFPKRLNAITTGEDDTVIFVADKFGDVYSMGVTGDIVLEKDMKPILGHVSMLTSILFAKDSKNSEFLITADRDEHIKISHYPQTYVIDKWLFGHREYIASVICPKWDPSLLLSAGGDDSVFLWNWESSKLLGKFKYSDLIQPYLTDDHLAPIRFQNEANDVIEFGVANVTALPDLPFVAFFVEATKLLFILKVDLEKSEGDMLSLVQQIEFPYNIVSASANNNSEFVVSLDNRSSGDKDFVKFIKLEKGTSNFVIDEDLSKSFDDVLISNLKEDPRVCVGDSRDVFPLYITSTLRKHGEHYS